MSFLVFLLKEIAVVDHLCSKKSTKDARSLKIIKMNELGGCNVVVLVLSCAGLMGSDQVDEIRN